VACDHYRRVKDDIALQSRLAMGAHRLSIEWGRIEPEDGRFDEAAIEHYRCEVAALREAGIEPMVTLHHFSFPSWLAKHGGCTAPELPDRFVRFTRRVVCALEDHVSLWITINEPNVLVAQGYLLGVWPPGLSSPRDVPRAVSTVRRAHRAAYAAIHDISPRARVGLAHHVRVATPATRKLRDCAAARLLDAAFNRPFLDLPQDFIGLNYYSRDIARFDRTKPQELFVARGIADGAPVSDLGWEIHPEGLGIVLRELARKRKPIWITENGIADATDAKRAAFSVDHLREVAVALDQSIDIRGYMHWSLMDNFEWAEGYAPRFGLYGVDYATQARTPRPSAEVYAEIAPMRRL
jgi:beta-glucosidase